MNYSNNINRILKSKDVHWEIKNKLRSNESCLFCIHGNEGWCFYTMDHSPYNHTPDLFHHLMTCKYFKNNE